jgi:hypothetical protein
LYAEPCGDEPPPNIPVGPTVEDFTNALVDHPKLDVTTPMDVTLAGYSGTYVDLRVPSDISACPASYFPWEPGIYAQGPGSRWLLWVLDVDGVRVVVQSTQRRGEALTALEPPRRRSRRITPKEMYRLQGNRSRLGPTRVSSNQSAESHEQLMTVVTTRRLRRPLRCRTAVRRPHLPNPTFANPASGNRRRIVRLEVASAECSHGPGNAICEKL